MTALVAFACGVVFTVGLGLARLTRPDVVLGFLDLSGDWDPRLAVMMPAAVLTYRLFHAGARRRARPLLASGFERPPRRGIDGSLLSGAAVFGVGWGLAGICPAPAVIGSVGNPGVAAFLGALVAGMALVEVARARGRTGGTAAGEGAEAGPACG